MGLDSPRLKRTGVVVLAGAIVLAVVLARVGTSHQSGTSRNAVSLSIAKQYATVAALRADTDLVAIVTVTSTPTPSAHLTNVPAVDLTLRVERVLAGEGRAGDAITLVQVGDPTGKVQIEEQVPPILEVGRHYLVYLNKQFPSQPQMVITGMAGVFAEDGSDKFHRLGNVSPGLPADLTVEQALS